MQLTQYIELGAYILSVLVILATVVVRFTPSKKDDEAVSTAGSVLFKVIHSLPTFGINPKTKELEAAYNELKAKQDAQSTDEKPAA